MNDVCMSSRLYTYVLSELIADTMFKVQCVSGMGNKKYEDIHHINTIRLTETCLLQSSKEGHNLRYLPDFNLSFYESQLQTKLLNALSILSSASEIREINKLKK